MTGWLTPAPSLYHLPEKYFGTVAITRDDLTWTENGKTITLKRGFPTDGVSLPGIALALKWDPFGAALRSALLHDAGYSLHDQLDLTLGGKATVDRRFRAGLKLDQPDTATLYYRAVRWFGWLAWHKANTALMTGYIYAVRHGTEDEWIAHVLKTYAQGTIDLRAAE